MPGYKTLRTLLNKRFMGLEFITFYLFCGSQLYLSRTGRVFPGSYNHYESVENWRISPRPSRYFTGNMSFLNHWISAACYFKNTSVVVYFCNVKIDILHPLILWAWSPSEDRQKTHSLINGPGSDKFADFDIKGGDWKARAAEVIIRFKR